MSINNTNRIAGPFTGTGVIAPYAFNFKVFQNSDVVATVTDLSGNEAPWVETTNYTLLLNPDQDVSPGGTLTPTAALPLNYLLTITSAVENLQPLVLTNAGAFLPNVINTALDRLTILVQQLQARLSTAITFPYSDGVQITQLPTKVQRLGKVFAFDATTGLPKMSNLTLDQIEAGSTNANAAAATAVAAAATATTKADLAVAAAAVAVPNANYYAGSTTGTNAYVATTGATALVAGQRYVINFTLANTNTTLTLNVDGLGAKNVRYQTAGGTLAAPAIGELTGNRFLIYDGTQFLLKDRHAFAKGLDFASAGTVDMTQQTGDYSQLTGTTTITAITLNNGDTKTIYYVGAGLTITLGASLTYGSAVAGSFAISTGDTLVVRRDGTVTRIVGYLPASGTPATSSVLLKAGGTMTGALVTVASAAGGAGLNIPHGAVPTTPVNGDIWTTTAGTFIQVNGATVALGAAFTPTYLWIREEQTSGTAAQTLAASWGTRILNTTKLNSISGASLASNKFTLPAGTYKINAVSPDNPGGGAGGKARLQNITDGTTVAYGTNVYGAFASGGNGSFNSSLNGVFTIAATKVFEIQHYSAGGNVGGRPISIASIPEVYTDVFIEKVA